MRAHRNGMLAAVAWGILASSPAAGQPADQGVRRIDPAMQLETEIHGGRPAVGDPVNYGLISKETDDPFGKDIESVALIDETPEEPESAGHDVLRIAGFVGLLLIPLAALIALIAVSRRASRRASI